MRLSRYKGILGRYARPDVTMDACESHHGTDPELVHLPRDTERCPTRECFTIVIQEQPTGPPPPPANGGNPAVAPEMVKPRQRELEEARRAIDREHARLDAVGPTARTRAREVGHRIETNADGFPLFDRANQCIVAATLLTQQLPQPSTPEEQRVPNGLKALLE